MTRRQSTVAIGGLLIGTALAARGVRQRRNLDLQERVALITGGSRGLGMLLAREVGALGAKVAIVARDAPKRNAYRHVRERHAQLHRLGACGWRVHGARMCGSDRRSGQLTSTVLVGSAAVRTSTCAVPLSGVTFTLTKQ